MIHYHYEDIEMPPLSEEVSLWLSKIISEEGKKLGEINYIFCNDAYLLQINQDFLEHDFYTDIITFDYVRGKTISGDIFVSLQRVSENASTLSTDIEEELKRVLAHGILHLCGYKDKTEAEQNEMRKKEDYYLSKTYN